MKFNFFPGIHAGFEIYVKVDPTPYVSTLLAILQLEESHLFRDSVKKLFKSLWQRERQNFSKVVAWT